MKVAVFEAGEGAWDAYGSLQPEHDVRCFAEALTPATVDRAADAQIVSAFVRSDFSAPVLARLPALAFIAARSTGYDHIDLAWCRQHRVSVSTVPDYGDATVAEHVFALLLALSRGLVDAVERTRGGDFSEPGPPGFELRGKTIGVVGTGRIGRRVIAIARGFDMNVLAHDIRPDAAAAAQAGFRYVALPDLLARSDIVTLHVPSSAGTRHLLADRELHAIRRGAVLINTARGSVIDPAALVRALADGRVAAAGLDVLAEEHLLRQPAGGGPDLPEAGREVLAANRLLLAHPNVLVTPHNAYNTREALARMTQTTLDNIRAFARGSPQNLVSAGDVPPGP